MIRRKATFIVAKNEQGSILLLKRPPDHARHPDQWTLPGGKIDMIGEGRCKGVEGHFGAYPGGYGESDTAAAAAEFEEETGKQSCVLAQLPITIISKEHEILCFEELVPVEEEVLPKEFPNVEHVEYMWLDSIDDVPDNTSDKVMYVLSYLISMGMWEEA